MSRAGILIRRAGTALLAAAAATACGRDSRGSPEGISGPTAAVREGARVTGTLHESLELKGSDGRLISRSLPPLPFEAVVRDGLARLDPVGGAVAATRPPAGGRRVLAFDDPEGRHHELVVAGDGVRGPLSRVRYSSDGDVVAEVAYQWDHRAGGWLLRERTLSLYRGARPALHHRRTAASLQLAQRGAVGQRSGSLAAAILAGLAPQALEAHTLVGCGSQWLAYIAASGAVAVALDSVLAAPWNPAGWSALATAISLWERVLDTLLTCEA